MSKTPIESKNDQHQFWQMAIETLPSRQTHVFENNS